MTMIVRDEADLLPFVLRHHLAHGVDSIHLIDHGSVDETPRLLAHLSAAGLPLTWRRREGPFEQQEMATELAEEAAATGADWVVTVDGDEFWQVRGGFKEFLGGRSDVDAVSLPVLNFVQWRYAPASGHTGLSTLITRPTTPVHKHAYDAASREESPPWIVRQEPRKAIARAGVLLGIGAHVPLDPGAVVRRSSKGACLHAPIRSRDALARKHRLERICGAADLESAWRDNTWVVPTRVGPKHAPAPLTIDLRLAAVFLGHVREVRRDVRAASG